MSRQSMPKPIRIVYFADSISSNNSWWRGLGPLQELQRSYPDEFVIEVPDRIDWSFLRRADVLYFGLCANDQGVNLATDAKHAGIKVVVDVDDLYWALPPGNPARLDFLAGHLTILTSLVSLADVALAPTVTLASEIKRRTNRTSVEVVRSGWPDRMVWPKRQTRQPVIAWRGGPVHEPDIHAVAPHIRTWLPDGWLFLACGSEPHPIPKHFDGRYHAWPIYPIDHFHRRLNDVRPSIVVTPLNDGLFNRCRSEIAYYEAAYCGAVLVAPNFPQFEGLPAMVTYDAPEAIGESLERAKAMSESDAACAEARAYIDAHRRSTHANELRRRILHGLFGE